MDKNEKRNFLLTLAGKGVSQAGTNLYSFAISFYILTVTESAQSFALSLILSTLPRILISPFAGNLVDRLNKKLIVVAADLISGMTMLLVFFITVNSALTLSMIYFASVILSVMLVFLNTSFTASYASIVSRDNLVKINSYQQTIGSFLQFISPILGGIIYAIIDIRMFLLINGISFLLSAFTETFIDFTYYSELKGREKQRKEFFKDMQEGFSYLRQQKQYITIMFYAFFINFFLASFSVVMPYNLLTILKLSSSHYGIVNASFPIGMMLMSLYVGRKEIRFTRGLFRNTMALLGIGMFLFALPVLSPFNLGNFIVPYYAAIMSFFAATVITIQIPLSVLTQTTIEEAYRGRVSGTVAVISEGIIPLAYIITGILVDIIPSYSILGVAGIMLLVIAVSIHFNQVIAHYDRKPDLVSP